MGTKNLRTNLSIYSLSTTRLLTIITTNATRVVMSNCASVAMETVNVGPSTLAWGDSSFSASTGGLLFYSQLKKWDNLNSGFSVLFIADGTNGSLLVNEYKA